MIKISVFTENLRFLRKRDGLTQDELAKKLLISRSRLANYEQGIREPDFETIEAIADCFNVTFDFLFGHTEPFDITDEEMRLIGAFRASDQVTRNNVLKLLDLPIKKAGLSSSAQVG